MCQSRLQTSYERTKTELRELQDLIEVKSKLDQNKVAAYQRLYYY